MSQPHPDPDTRIDDGIDAPTGSSGQVPDHARTPSGLEHELIAVIDVPLAGRWFTWPDWPTRVHAARRRRLPPTARPLIPND